MNILHIDYHEDGRDNEWKGYMTPTTGYRLAEGMKELGHTPYPFDMRHNPQEIPPGVIAKCDLCWICGQQLRWWNQSQLSEISRQMPVLLSYCDMRTFCEDWVLSATPHVDMVFYAAGGWRLRRFVEEWGFKRAAFLPGGIYDPIKYLGHKPNVERDIEWFFSGSETTIGDGARQADVAILKDEVGGAFVHPGMLGSDKVGGANHLKMLFRAKRGLSVNHYHASWPKYTSQRLYMYMICGIDVVARWFPEWDALLPPELLVYRDQGELLTLVRTKRRSESRVDKLQRWAQDNFTGSVVVQAALRMFEGKDTGHRWEEVWE